MLSQVLDHDPDGLYAVFVEIERNENPGLTIQKLNDIKHVVDITKWKFRSWPTKRLEDLHQMH